MNNLERASLAAFAGGVLTGVAILGIVLALLLPTCGEYELLIRHPDDGAWSCVDPYSSPNDW